LNEQLTTYGFYNTAKIYNRMGQYYYRIGEIQKAKILFFLSNLYSGTFTVKSPA